MSTFTLSTPQKYLTGCLVIVFVSCALILSYVGYNGYVENAVRPVVLDSYAVLPIGAEGQALDKGLRFGESFKQPSGYSTFNWLQGKVVLLPGAEGKFTDKFFTLYRGKVYLQVTAPLTINLGENNIKLDNVGGILDAEKLLFTIFAGEANIGSNQLKVNEYIQAVGKQITFGKFNRSELDLDSWKSIISTLKVAGIIPQSLLDLEGPQIVSLEPGASVTTTEELLILNGKLSEPVSKATLEGEDIKLNSSLEFVQGVKLKPGVNQITFDLTDLYGNTRTHTFSYTRTESASGQSSPSLPD